MSLQLIIPILLCLIIDLVYVDLVYLSLINEINSFVLTHLIWLNAWCLPSTIFIIASTKGSPHYSYYRLSINRAYKDRRRHNCGYVWWKHSSHESLVLYPMQIHCHYDSGTSFLDIIIAFKMYLCKHLKYT